MKSLKLVPLEEIPEAQATPTDNLIDLFKLINQMEKICTENNGIGLAAVQIGIPWNLFILNRNSKYEYYLNCSYEGKSHPVKSIEGCLSIKDSDGQIRRFELDRHSEVAIKGQRLVDYGELMLEDFESIETGLYSIVFQHEIDHARGILISTIGKEIKIS